MTLSASVQKLDNKIFLKGEYQAAVVHLGQLALSDIPAVELAVQAASLLTQVLQVENSLVWELSEDRQNLLLMAGSGEIESLSSISRIPLLAHSLEDKTLSSPDPILVEKFNRETQVKVLESDASHGMINGVSIRIGSIERPYGVIQVFSPQEQFISQNDIQFIQSIATLIGLSLRQTRRQHDQAAGPNGKISRARPAIHSDQLEWDWYEIKNRLVESRERERLRLAQDLHDAPIQDLYGMIYQLDDLRDALKDPEGETILDECDHTLHRVVNSLRTICRELRPPSLSPFGLEVAIRDHIEKFRDQNPDIKVNLDLMQDKQALSDSMRLTLFRIYQQAILNVARHAQATEAHVRLHLDDKTVTLEVEDNGTGFDVPEDWVELVRQEHFGLLGIAERVESIRGKLEILSALGDGTLVRVIVPYS
jgi:signal transduction histidine kinase